MDIPKVELTSQKVNSLTIIKTDLPVPSNFTQVINYYGQEKWVGLWVDFPKRLTVYDGKTMRTTLQLGWHSYLKYPQIKSKFHWLKQQGYGLIPKKTHFHQELMISHGILYQREEKLFYLCSVADLYPFLKRQVNFQGLDLTNPEIEKQWVEEFKILAMQQKLKLQNYKVYYTKVITQMKGWLDTYFAQVPESDLESVA